MSWWLYRWLRDSLYTWLGLAHKSGTVLLVGLDFAGKTTLLNLLKTDRFTCSAPTGNGSAEEVFISTGGEGGNLRLSAIDLGGHDQQRRVWRDYYHSVDAVVFMLDCTDRSRLSLAAEELRGVLSDPALMSSRQDGIPPPVAVIANKIDAPGAMGEAEVLYGLGIYHVRTGKVEGDNGEEHGRPLEVFMCSLLKRQGYGEAFRWIARFL